MIHQLGKDLVHRTQQIGGISLHRKYTSLEEVYKHHLSNFNNYLSKLLQLNKDHCNYLGHIKNLVLLHIEMVCLHWERNNLFLEIYNYQYYLKNRIPMYLHQLIHNLHCFQYSLYQCYKDLFHFGIHLLVVRILLTCYIFLSGFVNCNLLLQDFHS